MTMEQTYFKGYEAALIDIASGEPVDKFKYLIPRLSGRFAAFCRGYAYALEDEGVFGQQITQSLIITIDQKSSHWYVGYPQERPVDFSRYQSWPSSWRGDFKIKVRQQRILF